MSKLHAIGGDFHEAIESLEIPSYVVDPHGIIRWQNPAALHLVGDVRGRQFTSVVIPEQAPRARQNFARRLLGGPPPTDTSFVLVGTDGSRVSVEMSSVRLMEDHHVVGVFGQVADIHEELPHALPHHLTPRQAEVLRMLEHGRSTEQIAGELHLSTETVRNHVRHLLRALGVHTRLEAVAVARREHLVA